MKQQTKWVVFVTFVSILLASRVSPATAQDNKPQLERRRCPFPMPVGEIDGVTIQCGTVSVLQDRAKAGGYQVNLAFSVLKSRSQPALPDAVIHLHGGPGGSSLLFVDANVRVFESLRTKRDVVLFDQRGGGLSQPNLNCYNIIDPDRLEKTIVNVPPGRDVKRIKTLVACATELKAKGIDPVFYNTAENARDVLELASALGLSQFNLTGVSYGTRLAQEIMRLKPVGLRSVVLDSSLAPTTRAYEDFYIKGWLVIETVLADCARDTACSQRYPNLRMRVPQLLARLDAAPAKARLGDTEYTLDGYALMKPFIQSQDIPEVVPYLPRMFDEVDRGKYDTYFAIVNGEIDQLDHPAPQPVTLNTKMPAGAFDRAVRDAIDKLDEDKANTARNSYFTALGELRGRTAIRNVLLAQFNKDAAASLMSLFAVLSDSDLEDLYRANRMIASASREMGIFKAYECHDAYPFNDFNKLEANARTLPFAIPQDELDKQRATIQDCDYWPTGVAAKEITQPVSSTVPVLVLQGRYDFVTPPLWGRAVARQFPQATYAEIGQSGHGTRVYSECARKIVTQFVDAPGMKLDLSCLPGTQVRFVT